MKDDTGQEVTPSLVTQKPKPENETREEIAAYFSARRNWNLRDNPSRWRTCPLDLI